MAKLFRICRAAFDLSDPSGSSQYPGRWNSQGQPVLYFSASLALCVLELRANAVEFSTIKNGYHYGEIDIDFDQAPIEDLPKNFYADNWALNKKLTRGYADNWLRNEKAMVLKVNSAVLPTDSNFIINVAHRDFLKVSFSDPLPVPLDARLS